MEKYNVIKKIGKGGQGSVYLVSKKTNENIKFALKIIHFDKLEDANKAIQEVQVLQNVHDPNLTEYYDLFLNQNEISEDLTVNIIMPYYPRGDLWAFMESIEGGLAEDVILKFAKNITEGLQALHKSNIAHRDLKPENLLISEDENGELSLIIGDFGLSKKMSSMSIMKTICGTPYFMAPEIFSDTKYGVKVDIFSLGAILYYLMTKKTRLFHVDIVKNKNLNLELRKEMEKEYSSHLITLTLLLLSVKEKDRPSAYDIHQLLTDLEKKKLSFIAGYVPKNVYSHSCILHESSMIIFGGYYESDTNNIYEFNFEAIDWKNLNSKSFSNYKQNPHGRSWHKSVYYNNSMYIVGGCSDRYLSDIYQYDFEKNSWRMIKKHFSHSIASPSVVVYEDSMYIFGGFHKEMTLQVFDHFYQYNFTDEKLLLLDQIDRPTPRYGHTAIVYKSFMFVFGGQYDDDAIEKDDYLWCYDFEEKKWESLDSKGDLPTSRWDHTACLYKNKLIVFGGINRGGNKIKFSHDMFYELDLDLLVWKEIKLKGDYPLKRMGHVSVVYKNHMYIHGGINWNYSVCSELYKCDLLDDYKFSNLSQNQAILKARWGNKYIKNCRVCAIYLSKERYICKNCFVTFCTECHDKVIDTKLSKKELKKVPKCSHEWILSTSFDQAFHLFLTPEAPNWNGRNESKFRTVRQTIQKMNKMNKDLHTTPSPVSPWNLTKDNIDNKNEISILKQRISFLENEVSDLKIVNEKLTKENEILKKDEIQK